ncbi:MAG TPA: methylated-DNA--[protein]-cysteine S-methyltransferase [Pseudomonadales bacterium]|nr:methylated-DNA--[protein]-cysteine S-methyltransferase [Pseudomonadales bacterium]
MSSQMRRYHSVLTTPIGPLLLVGDGEALQRLLFPVAGAVAPKVDAGRRDDGALATPRAQLEAYFAGDRRSFELRLAPQGTPFQQQVWAALQRIPFGTTISYGTLAERIGRPTASRAVGAANGRNPLPVIVPCHRVIGADGSLTGFGGGLPCKQWLLGHEGALPRAAQPGLFD